MQRFWNEHGMGGVRDDCRLRCGVESRMGLVFAAESEVHAVSWTDLTTGFG